MHIGAKTKHWGKKTACRAQKQDCIKPHIWGRNQKKWCCIEGSQKHVVSVTLNGRSLKHPGLELASWPNWAIDGEGLWLSADQEPDGHSSCAPWSYVEMGETYRRTNITATLHRSGLYGGAARRNPLLSEDTWKQTLNLQKAPKGPSDCEKQDSLVWWTSFPSIMFEGNQALLVTFRVSSQK